MEYEIIRDAHNEMMDKLIENKEKSKKEFERELRRLRK